MTSRHLIQHQASTADCRIYSILRGESRLDLVRDETLKTIFEETAEKYSETIALLFGSVKLTYRQLNSAANAAASVLLSHGACPGQVVGLWLSRGSNLLVVQLAIVKSGAAWIPFDADTPLDRVCSCLEDSQAILLITERHNFDEVSKKLPLNANLKFSVVIDRQLLSGPITCSNPTSQAHSTDTAYIIYTSGSTGKPKGIAISNRNVCHLLRSENTVVHIQPNDRVYQGFSISFDMSFEEIWMSYLVGASIWIAPKEIAYNPEDICDALINHNITVFHTVPTLLSLIEKDIPSLRILNLGGEPCPASLAARWVTPTRTVFNSYGPTETTVTATLLALRPSDTITIGTPLPNYDAMVIDTEALPELRLVPRGLSGELCIAGPGLAAGYVGRPDLTREKFLANPWSITHLDEKLYRTGDLAFIDEYDRIQCLGRVDDQIKIRGYRVELGEIEATVGRLNGIGTVAVVLKSEVHIDRIVAYYVPSSDSQSLSSGSNHVEWRSELTATLPPYMIPSLFQPLEAMPRLASGKIDKNALKARPFPAVTEGCYIIQLGLEIALRTEAEKDIYSILQVLFPGQVITSKSDFFTDLGGNSVFASQLVSLLRRNPKYLQATVRDVYRLREFGAISDELQSKVPLTSGDHIQRHHEPMVEISLGIYWLCGLLQAVVVILLRGLSTGMFMAPFLIYYLSEYDELFCLVLAVGIYLASLPLSFLLAFIGKWLVIGRLQPGRYPLWGWKYLRIWVADHFMALAPVYLITGTPYYSVWLWALGADIGCDVYLSEITRVRSPDLLKIGSYSSVGGGVSFENIRVERGEVVVGRITVGTHCYIGQSALLDASTCMRDWSRLDELSCLTEGTTVATEGVWSGCPAVQTNTFSSGDVHQEYGASLACRVMETVCYLLGMVTIALLFYLPIFPAFIMLHYMNRSGVDLIFNSLPHWSADSLSIVIFGMSFIVCIPISICFTIMLACCTVLLRWCVLPRLRSGSWPIHSRLSMQKWVVDLIISQSNTAMHGAFATVYTPFWLRLLGARVGTNTEISFSTGMVPELMDFGDETFSADAVSFSSTSVDAGIMTLGCITVGRRSFLGNICNISKDTIIPENCLIGVNSQCPKGTVCRTGDTWVGSPPIRIPVREVTTGYPDYLTYKPSYWRKAARGCIELVRIITPGAFSIAFSYTYAVVLEDAWSNGLMTKFFLLYFSSGIVYGLSCLLFIMILKWGFIGRYKPSIYHMATPFVWTSEAVTSLYETMLVPNLFIDLMGTPWLPFFLRFLGCKIGSGVYLNTAEITEWDCVEIGDYSEAESFENFQTHLFEDRLMKIGVVRVGAGVTLRARGTVLFGAVVGDQALIGPLTLVMKGEAIPAHSRWIGCPAAPMADSGVGQGIDNGQGVGVGTGLGVGLRTNVGVGSNIEEGEEVKDAIIV